MYLKVVLSKVDPEGNNFAWTRRIGHALLKSSVIEIGGTRIDKQCGTWLDVWYELARQGDHERGYNIMIGDVPKLTEYDSQVKKEYVLYIPLQFWFCRFIGLSVPMIALQYHDVFLHVEFDKISNLIISDGKFDNNKATIKEASILSNYIFLDTDERRRFAISGHEYLIEQVQFNGVEPVLNEETKYTLDFNHPTKELIWLCRNGNFSSGKKFMYYTHKDKWSVKEAAKKIIRESISISFNPSNEVGGTWIPVPGHCVQQVNNWSIYNKNDEYVYVNPTSLVNITDKINADIVISKEGIIECYNIKTSLGLEELSMSVEQMVDTRYNALDPKVNIFSNYGLYIDGSCNPINKALLQFNSINRFDRREGIYFNYVQAEQHHENTPKDGINCYSFALHPDELQPSGSANMSRIESSQLTIWFKSTKKSNYFTLENKLYIFARSYNILRIYAGLSGLAYML
ncbi:MAG: NCLDV major capsid protein [Barrevirus sp.]|uniref:NCLDV major capsid protein n=1 Tax=Barrevirus sp. TaxID=2487763 RepID=A0A3G4ZR06_9VIRU|nr:MAG: NCLDV major capsid protein [Barrevirus sp.]